MGVPLTSDLQKCVNTTRSALRGAGPSQLKDHFHVPVLTKVLQETAGTEGFTPERVTHMADALLICCWWMFREIEAAGSQVCHVSMNPGAMEVTIMLPVQKNDARGMLCCRTLRCACRVSRQALCPYHAVKRHLQRLALRGPEALASRAPLFPADDGGVLTKALFVKQVRATLGACDVELTREYEGQELQRFTGHIARVSGAQWLHNLGLPMQLVQTNLRSVGIADDSEVPAVGSSSGVAGVSCQRPGERSSGRRPRGRLDVGAGHRGRSFDGARPGEPRGARAA